MFEKLLHGRSIKDALFSLVPLILFVVGAFYVFTRYINPPPPDHFIITTGDSEGEYNFYGKLYQDYLKDEGIDLQIQKSRGAQDNLNHLKDENSDADVGFVQDGLGSPDEAPNLYSLGSVFYEPIWIFYRGTAELTRLSQLQGKRIAVGKDGGGTQTLTLRLLSDAEVTEQNSMLRKIGWDEAENALKNGSIDAAFFLASPNDSTVQRLLFEPSLRLMSLDQSEAITKRIPFLHHLVLPHGAIDLRRNIPSQDTHLVSPTATILVKDTLHPALVYLLLQTISHVHSDPGLFEKKHEFPIDKDFQFPLADEAKTFYKSGPPFWQKHLPFWIATLFDRFLFLSLPLLVLLFPILKLIPRLYHWRIRNRIHQRYGELKFLETQIKTDAERKQFDRHLSELDQIEERVNEMNLPLEYSNHLYSLKGHIDFVRGRVRSRDIRPS